jgi:hypothetical protein
VSKVIQVLVILSLVAGLILIAGMSNQGARVGAQSGSPWIDVIYSSSDPLGAHHILMDQRHGPDCGQCHDGYGQDAPKSLVGVPYVTMGDGQTCVSCHDGRYIGQLFLSQMTVNNKFYSCSDCHQVK